jgi:hypothetical protein
MPMNNYPLRAWADGWPPVTALDMSAINQAIGSLDARVAVVEDLVATMGRGRVNGGNSTTGPSNVTTTETVFHTLTTNLEARRFRYTWAGTLVGNGATGSPYFNVRIRVQYGSSLVVAGSTEVINSPITLALGGNWDHHEFAGEFYLPTPGTVTVGMTILRTAGTGGVDVRGGAYYFLDDVAPA